MNKAALIATIALLPVLAYAPLTSASPEQSQRTSGITKLDKPLGVDDQITSTLAELQRKV